MRQKRLKRQFENCPAETSTRKTLTTSKPQNLELLGSMKRPIDLLEAEVRVQQNIPKKIRTSQENWIPVTQIPAAAAQKREVNQGHVVKKPFIIIRRRPITFEYRVIFEYNSKQDSIFFTVERITPAEGPKKVWDNLIKQVGVIFVKSLKDLKTQPRIKLLGDHMHCLAVWNSLFNKPLRNGKFSKESVKFIEQLRAFENEISEQQWISHFLKFISQFFDKELKKSQRMKPENVLIYQELSAPIIIAGKILGQLPPEILNETSYLMIEEWNGNRVKFSITLGSEDQKELCEKLKRCTAVNKIHFYNSFEPDFTQFKFEIDDKEEDAEEEKKEVAPIAEPADNLNIDALDAMTDVFENLDPGQNDVLTGHTIYEISNDKSPDWQQPHSPGNPRPDLVSECDKESHYHFDHLTENSENEKSQDAYNISDDKFIDIFNPVNDN